jgi:glucokinase-like ROK family protein
MAMKHHYRTGDQTLLREINLSRVLYCLQEDEALSRSKLATLTGLNKTTISSLIEALLAWGLVHEIGLDTSGTGRPATLLALNPQAGSIIGVELGVEFISVILTDFTGQITWQHLTEINPTDPQEEIIQQVLGMIDQAKGDRAERLLGVGVAVPGMVDVANGVLLFSPNLQWRNVALRQIFQDHIHLPVFLENDANAAAIGEYFFGNARQVQNFICLTIGIGIGGGLFLNGDLYRGRGGLAGEVGHTNLLTEGNRPCRCGNRGCWETAGNQYALIERVRALLDVGHASLIPQLIVGENSRLTLSSIAQAAEAQDPVALEALSETGAAIGLGVANLINIFNPEMVIISGALSSVGEYLLPDIKAVVERQALVETRHHTQIIPSKFGPMATVIGAASLVVSAILFDPTRLKQL